jgi:hypothetical protein
MRNEVDEDSARRLDRILKVVDVNEGRGVALLVAAGNRYPGSLVRLAPSAAS